MSVAHDGKRLASGGLDGKVRIWSTDTVYKLLGGGDESSVAGMPRQLCSMSTHTGAVTTVRFSPSGKYLASGSDDRVVLIWERDETRAPRQEFGSQAESDSEVWVARKRLVGHDNDVQDLAWSPDGALLVTVGLDSSIIVWSGTTFEKLKRLDAHQSHVKGVVFDPANKYFATASDDRTVRIVRYHRSSPTEITFSTETTISAPFDGSPLSTYYRRLSWSPDGNHIAAANAVNGPVTTVAIINRGVWDSDISLIGHEAPCEVAAFCPQVLSRVPLAERAKLPDPSRALMTVVASAGQDKTLAIWNTSSPRPLLVARNVATKAITDLAWSPDGRKLFASSLDGTILMASFDEGELGYAIPQEEAETQLLKYGGRRDEMQIPESVDQLLLEEKVAELTQDQKEKRMDEIMGAGSGADVEMKDTFDKPSENAGTPNVLETRAMDKPAASSAGASGGPATGSANGTSATVTTGTTGTGTGTTGTGAASATTSNGTAPKVNILNTQKVTITKDGKKRVAPQLVTTAAPQGQQAAPKLQGSLVSSATRSSVDGESVLQAIDMSKPSHALPKGGVSALVIGNKQKAVEEGEDGTADGHAAKKHKGAAKKDENVPEYIRPAVVSPATTVAQTRLAVPKVRSTIACNGGGGAGEGDGDKDRAVLEIRNGTGNEQEPTRVIVTKGDEVLFVDFLPRHGLLATGQEGSFWVVATEDGTLHFYSATGRRLMSPTVLGAAPTILESQGPYVLAITSIGLVHVWHVEEQRALFAPVSLAPVLDSATKVLESGLLRAPSITQAAVTGKGAVVVTLNNGSAFTYSHQMMAWQRISEQWWAIGSQYWDSTDASSSLSGGLGSAAGGIIGLVERRTNAEVVLKAGSRGRLLQRMAKNRMLQVGYEAFESVVSVAHLENRVCAAILLDSSRELSRYLPMYGRRLAEDGLKERLNELCSSLLGPTLVDPDSDELKWEEELAGVKKHDLLKQIILAAAKIRDVQSVLLPYASALGIVGQLETA